VVSDTTVDETLSVMESTEPHSSEMSIARKIDVTVATKNSARTLDKCLEAIRSGIPVRQLVVVDGGSSDSTLEIARRHHAIVVTETGLLGKVRYVQAQNCDTEWIAFIDSDIYVYKSWWPAVAKHIQINDVGMILGFSDAPVVTLPIYEDYLKHLARKFGAAAFSNTLVKRELVLSCKELLNNIHAGEDTILARYIRKHHMRIVTIPIPLCLHDKIAVNDHPMAFYRWGRSARMVGGREGLKNVAKTLKNNVRNWLIFTWDTKRVSIRLFVFLFCLWGWMLRGYVHPHGTFPARNGSTHK
jgi:glycosyltransferase involved in cell wall biosynthesis